MFRYILIFLGFSSLTACDSSDSPLAEGLDQAITENQCSVPGQNDFVYQVMQDIYFWNTEIPMVDPGSFASPEDLLEAIRFRPLDQTFSTIQIAAEQSLFFAEGQSVAVGVTLVFDGAGALRIAETIVGGPAEIAGIRRGDEITAINGVAIADVLAGPAYWRAAFGADEIGTPVQLAITNLANMQTVYDLEKVLVTIDPVPVTAIFDANGIQVGYLNFKTFITPSFNQLEAAFETFVAGNVTELILDLRYNGGGVFIGGSVFGRSYRWCQYRWANLF